MEFIVFNETSTNDISHRFVFLDETQWFLKKMVSRSWEKSLNIAICDHFAW